MPRLIIRQNRRSLVAAFDNFEREYPARVIGRVMRPWAKMVVQSVKRQRSKPKNRSHMMRNNFEAQVQQQRALEVRFFSTARSRKGFRYWIAQQYGTRHGVPATDFVGRAVRSNRGALTRMLRDETARQARESGL